jgi:hypothetical protein
MIFASAGDPAKNPMIKRQFRKFNSEIEPAGDRPIYGFPF